jgi:hypothetical protein
MLPVIYYGIYLVANQLYIYLDLIVTRFKKIAYLQRLTFFFLPVQLYDIKATWINAHQQKKPTIIAILVVNDPKAICPSEPVLIITSG